MISIDTIAGNVFRYIEACNEKKNQQLELELNRHSFKRENLGKIYADLTGVVNMYPSQSPNDLLAILDYDCTSYSNEWFDIVDHTLEYQAKEKETELNNNIKCFSREDIYDIKRYINTRQSLRKDIDKIKTEYFAAKKSFSSFLDLHKKEIDLFAGNSVKNCLVIFQVVIDNVFISGMPAIDEKDRHYSVIEKARNSLIDSMREDLGIY